MIDTSAVVAEFGAYYLSNRGNMSRLVKRLKYGFVSADMFTKLPIDNTRYETVESQFDEVIQPYQDTFTPKGALTFTPQVISLYQQKIDQFQNPSNLEATWLGFLADKEDQDRTNWPFIRWLIEEHLIGKAAEDMEMKAIYSGIPAAITVGTPGTAIGSFLGIKKQFADYVTAGKMSPIAMGAPATNDIDFVNQVEAFADEIDTRYWRFAMNLCMQETLARRFSRGYRDKYGRNIDFTGGQLITKVEDTNMTVVGLPSMMGSNRFWVTPKSNAVLVTKRDKGLMNFQIERLDRNTKIFSDWWAGAGFIIPEIVFINDQA